MSKFPLKTVPKVWGREEWLINEPEYCAKYLYINKDAKGSLHYHPKKKETFIVLEGRVELELRSGGGIWTWLIEPTTTINPMTPHRIKGITDAKVLEISTHHDDDDVVRLEESKA